MDQEEGAIRYQVGEAMKRARALWWVPQPSTRRPKWKFLVMKDGVEMARTLTLQKAEELAEAIGNCVIEAYPQERAS